MSSNFGIGGSTSATSGFSPAPPKETRAIEGHIADFASAWNRHDPEQMASLWAEDGDLINPFGRVAQGRDQVEQLFREEHQGPMKNCIHQMSIGSVRLLGNDLAIAEGDCLLTGMRDLENKEVPAMKPHVSFVLGKKQGQWQILAARAYLYASAPGVKS